MKPKAAAAHPPVLKLEIHRQRLPLHREFLSERFTLGRGHENRFIAEDLPMERFILLSPPQNHQPWMLRFNSEMDGFICLGDQDTLLLSAIRRMHRSARVEPDVWCVPLHRIGSVRVDIGQFNILCHPPFPTSPRADRVSV